MKTKTIIALAPVLVLIIVLTAGAASKPTGGIANLPPRHDTDRPGIEYRVVRIEGRDYVATRSRYWPGGGEKWDLVGINP